MIKYGLMACLMGSSSVGIAGITSNLLLQGLKLRSVATRNAVPRALVRAASLKIKDKGSRFEGMDLKSLCEEENRIVLRIAELEKMSEESKEIRNPATGVRYYISHEECVLHADLERLRIHKKVLSLPISDQKYFSDLSKREHDLRCNLGIGDIVAVVSDDNEEKEAWVKKEEAWSEELDILLAKKEKFIAALTINDKSKKDNND